MSKKPTARLVFKEGQRVKLRRAQGVGTVDETWFDIGKERVSVVWDATGCCSDYAADDLEIVT